jgi:[ribosomal protein S5]-alanine N-acetyltransferase
MRRGVAHDTNEHRDRDAVGAHRRLFTRRPSREPGVGIRTRTVKKISTPRLELIAATLDLLNAELESSDKLSAMLNAHVPAGWPPGEYDEAAMRWFCDQLYAHPEAVGWFSWYALLRSEVGAQPTLIGSAGFMGPPDDDGVVETGYSILPAFEGRGFATEIVSGLLRHAFDDGRVRDVIAHTTPVNAGSIRVLEKNGFACEGPGAEQGTVRYGRTR